MEKGEHKEKRRQSSRSFTMTEVGESFGTFTIYINDSHPDFGVAMQHCDNSKRLRNALNVGLRAQYIFQRKGGDTDLSITDKLGIGGYVRNNAMKYNGYALGAFSKIVMPIQGITLPSKMVQSVQAELAESWSSFFSLRKKGHIKTNIPGYKHGLGSAIYRVDTLSKKWLSRGIVKPTGWSQGVDVSRIYDDSMSIRKVQFIPVTEHKARFIVSYKKREVHNYSPTQGLYAGIDVGVSNLFTVAFNDFRKGIIIDGEPLKRTNSHYNALISRLTSKLDVERRNIDKKVNKGMKRDDENYIMVYRKKSSRLSLLWDKRERKLKHYYTTATNALVSQLCSAGVEKVFIGWNPHFKASPSMGRRNNRKFSSIPMRRIIDDMTRKLSSRGIEVIETEESYTSKSSFLDNDILPLYSHDSDERYSFSGRRVSRGEYVSASGVHINADLNGAYNIIRKCEPQFCFTEPGEGNFADAVTGNVVSQVERLSFRY